MNIYNFHSITKEYLTTVVAEADPAETKKQGKFIPLVPANATLIEPPIVEINQVAVFENNKWIIKADYRKNYVKVDDNFQVQEITTIGEQEGFYVVDKATGELIKENPNNFKIQDGEVVQKTEIEIEQEKALEEIELIKGQLSELDSKTIRPLRAIMSGDYNTEDKETLNSIEEEAKRLREKILTLESESLTRK